MKLKVIIGIFCLLILNTINVTADPLPIISINSPEVGIYNSGLISLDISTNIPAGCSYSEDNISYNILSNRANRSHTDDIVLGNGRNTIYFLCANAINEFNSASVTLLINRTNYVSSCGEILFDHADYYLDTDETWACRLRSLDDIVLDCQSHILYNGTILNNVVNSYIRNCNITAATRHSISLTSSSEVYIYDNTIYNGTGNAIRLGNNAGNITIMDNHFIQAVQSPINSFITADSRNVRNITVNGNYFNATVPIRTISGAWFKVDSYYPTVRIKLFNNIMNMRAVRIFGSNSFLLNTTLRTAINRMGGARIGGNWWLGFSDNYALCGPNANGICTNSYSNGSFIDYLPITALAP